MTKYIMMKSFVVIRVLNKVFRDIIKYRMMTPIPLLLNFTKLCDEPFVLAAIDKNF